MHSTLPNWSRSPGQARADWEIIVALANRCGAEWDYQSASDVYDELARYAPKFAGISHARIEAEGGRQWPCPTPDHPGTPTMHEGAPIKGTAPRGVDRAEQLLVGQHLLHVLHLLLAEREISMTHNIRFIRICRTQSI